MAVQRRTRRVVRAEVAAALEGNGDTSLLRRRKRGEKHLANFIPDGEVRDRLAEELMEKEAGVGIRPPKWSTATFDITGGDLDTDTGEIDPVPLVQNAFPAKAREQIKRTQELGTQAKSKRIREPKDFDRCYREAMHISREGWHGIPAASFRHALISACRLVNFKMTIAKLTIRVKADGYDAADGMPLVRITKGEPHMVIHPVRNDNGGVDLRARPMWDEWDATLRIKFDTEHFSLQDIANLLLRAGNGGVGEGRNDSKNSAGMGWGSFAIKNARIVKKA